MEEERDSHKDYEWFDEIPFWANGRGITNMKRTRLYLLDLNTHLPDFGADCQRLHRSYSRR